MGELCQIVSGSWTELRASPPQLYYFQHFQNVFHPAHYQGWGRRRRYFEGWYYKLVVPEQRLAYAIIPGISMDAVGQQHAFVQVLDGVAAQSSYHRFPATDFRPTRGALDLAVGPDNRFTDHSLRLRLPNLALDAEFLQAQRWPSRLAAPGVMGPFGYIPGMQCYHGLVSLHHGLSGSLTDARGTYDLGTGVGYAEKDWGSSFPNAWVWAQSNHLDSPHPSSLMVSVADIPWLGTRFTGFLATLLWEGELHTFATWTGARQELSFAEGSVTVRLTDRRRR
ncbi:MAG: hypothetical protein HC821_03395 [Lewinella sp.]|nr:hypothetical protein [Lewinella sp.]